MLMLHFTLINSRETRKVGDDKIDLTLRVGTVVVMMRQVVYHNLDLKRYFL